MKNVFLINPTAGKAAARKKLIANIEAYVAEHADTCQTCYTTCKSDGTRIARELAQSGEQLRIFSCGGDGSAFDVLNGIIGYDNVVLGVMPAGTGNDFLKSFTQNQHFFDLEDQINGTECRLDIIRAGDFVCLNQATMGFDAQVGANKDKFSRLPLIGGQFAYILSVLYCFLSAVKNRMTVQVDDNTPVEKEFLFAVAANGRFYGGGFQSAPLALVEDGLLDCMTIDTVSRLRILSLLGKYTRGEHVDLPICNYRRGKTMRVIAHKDTIVNLDGEILPARDVRFEIVPRAVRFSLPRGSGLPNEPSVCVNEKEPATVQ